MSREQVLSALASGQVLKPLDSLGFPGQWGCLPISAGGTLVGCDLRELDRLLIEGLIERVPDFGYVLARNPPAPVSAHARAARG
jgi:hypothetical protein